VAVLSLAVGIGVNTALFTYVYAILLEPVPGMGDADKVVELLLTRRGQEQQEWAYPDFQDLGQAETPIKALAGWKLRDGSLTTADGSERVRVMYVSADYFRVLGVVPARGRDFLPSEDVRPGEHPVAVVSHDLWQNRLGGGPEIIGATINLNRTLYTVVGVAPEEFKGHRPILSNTDLWVPLTQHAMLTGPRNAERDRAFLWLLTIGRLQDDATVSQANAALQTVFARLAQENPETNEDRGAKAFRFGPIPAYGRAGSVIFTAGLVALTGLVLLIICGNVAGMMLARSVTREREIAVRMALGSGRGRLVRHLMVEALVLALLGGSLGVLLAFWATGAASSSSIAIDIPNVSLRPNFMILVFSLGLMFVTTLAIGLLPALRFSRPELVSSLKDDAGGGGRRVGRVHRWAASAQTGLAVFLLVISGLFLRAMVELDRRDLGFEPRNLLVTNLDLSTEGYETLEETRGFFDRVNQSVGSLPGLASVSLADGIPLDQVGNFTRVSRADQLDETDARVVVEFTRASEGFFRTIGTPILRGRAFEPGDDATSERIVIITQALAERMWPGQDALGRRLRFRVARDTTQELTVVGIVPNVASSRATENWPHVFVALRQHFWPRVMIVARGTGDASTLIRPIQSAILDADPTLPIPRVVTSESLVARGTQGQRSTARMAGGLGLLALILSAIGVYGVVAFAVAHRTREIGLRMALGASRPQVLGAVLRDAVRLAVPGLAAGALLAAGLGIGMRSLLLGVSPADPISFGCAAGMLFLVVLLASLVPARRASGIDPMAALRSE
jgi:predicted permease